MRRKSIVLWLQCHAVQAIVIFLALYGVVSASVRPASACIVDSCLQDGFFGARTAPDGGTSLIDPPAANAATFRQQNSNDQRTFMPGRWQPGSPAGILAKMELLVPARHRPEDNRTLLIEFGLWSLAGTALLAVIVRKKYRSLKRYVDVVASIILLSAFAPLMLIIALLIWIDSPGPVIIRQVRVGLNRRAARNGHRPGERRKFRSYGSLFMLYKFRTMYADAEAKTGPVWARQNDERITRVGELLRKTHLDELPQFVNVLKGDMGIIGPRPERPVFTEQLNSHIRNFVKRLQVKPGITGLAQVRYRYTASIADTRKKLKYDLLYIKKMCLTMDMRILLNTFNMLMTTDKGAR